MKKIIRAKHLGFCFGVKRAVELAYETARNNKATKVYSLGELIHNEAVTQKLTKEGIFLKNSVEDMQKGGIMIVRSHGAGKATYEKAGKQGLKIVDATCPYVSKIHKLVNEAYLSGKQVIIAGNKAHPEVEGISGWCENSAIIISNAGELAQFNLQGKNIFLVAQTTLKQDVFDEIKKELEKISKTSEIQNTICYVTEERQIVAAELAKKVDAVVVVGGKNSSNTQKLYEIAKKYCQKVYFIENKQNLPLQEIQFYNTIGVVAGASTPEHLIEEVIANMSEIITENKQTNPMDEFMADIERASKLPKSGENVEGVIIEVREKEIIVNINCKKDAIIPKDEMSIGENGDLRELFKVGDMIEARVIKHDDGDGNILLSRKKIEADKYWEELKVASEEKTAVDVKVLKEVKGGVLASYKEITGLIPYAGLSDRYVDKGEDFIGKTLRVKVVKIDAKRGRVVFSHRLYLNEIRQKALDEIWGTLSVGDIVEGTVMRFTDYGAFVDIGGVDGLLHISEISWGKLKHPQQMLTIGEKIPVKILAMNRENEKISLGYKQTKPEPWSNIEERYEIGQRISGKVVQIKEYGAFVELEPGLDGLVHISEISNSRIENVADVLAQDKEIEAEILAIDHERRRISLSIKATLPKEAKAADEDVEKSEEVADEPTADAE
ncbi:MAG: bifunctional 4-hydroxy-3-methylbut-2-enyl diphosphate reductase/30S ribosomal protein S1 [Eubacteriales bacterium]